MREKKNPPVIFLRFHVFKFTWIPAGPFRTGILLSEDLITFTNTVDSDEMQHYAAFHLGLHCLQK